MTSHKEHCAVIELFTEFEKKRKIFLQANWILGFVFAYTYFAMGGHEAQNSSRSNHGPIWALASILITVAVIQGFVGGWQSVVIAQILLFVGITGWRVVFEK